MKIKRLVFPALAATLAACASSPGGEIPVSSMAQSTATRPAALGARPATAEATVGKNIEQEQTGPQGGDLSGQSAAMVKVGEPRIIRGNDRVIATPKQPPPIEGGGNSFNFEEAPISEVVHVMMRDILKADYILHQPVTGSVTLATKARVSNDQALAMLESALQANGLLMARDTRGVYHIGKPDALKGIVAATRQVGKGPLPPGYGAIVVPLQFIGAAEMATILRPMMQADSLVRVDSLRNLLVLAGTRTQAEGWLDLVATFDVDLLKGMSVGVFPLKYASIKEVEAALSLVSGGVAATSPGGTAAAAAAPRTGSAVGMPASGGGATPPSSLGEANPLFGALRIMPIERLNSILVVTPRAVYLEEARRWIERLDQPSENNAEPQLFIYKVQNINARHLATVLSGIFGGQASSGANNNTGVAPGLASGTGSSLGQSSTLGSSSGSFGSGNTFGSSAFSSGNNGAGGRTSGLQAGTSVVQGARNTQGGAGQAVVAANLGSIRVMADELNNSVLVWSSKGEYTKIEATLKRLDLPLTQVLIEASIVEVTLTDDLKYGLQWAFSDGRSNGYTGQGQISAREDGGLGGLAQGFTYSLSNSAGTLKAVLNALATKSLVKMISNPSLMVLDNHSASIAVGSQTPVRTQTTSFVENPTAQTSTIQYKDTGVNLSVTPSVNSGNIVSMQIDQSVTDVGEVDQPSGQRAFLQRQISSKVAVRSGESIVLGGLIKDNATTGKTGVPLLQDIPVVGKLFGTNSTNGNRTELLVIITPRVVRSDIDIREVSEDLRDRMKGLQGIDVQTSPPLSKSNTLQSIPSQ